MDHILWMIQHHPEWDGFAATPYRSVVNPPGLPLDRTSYDLVKKAWEQQIVSTQNSGRVLHNAAMFFAFKAPAVSAELLKRAIKLEPGEPVYLERLGMIYAISLMPPSSREDGIADNPAFQLLADEARSALQVSLDWVLLAGALTAVYGSTEPDEPDLSVKLKQVRPGEEAWEIVRKLPSRGWLRSRCDARANGRR